MKAVFSFAAASLFGAAGGVLGGMGETLLAQLFGSSVQVIANLFTSYTSDCMKAKEHKQIESSRGIEKVIIVALARSIGILRTHPEVEAYKKEIEAGIRNGIHYEEEDRSRLAYFFHFWENYTDISRISEDRLKCFDALDISPYEFDAAKPEKLETYLNRIIFTDFEHLNKIAKLKTVIQHIISPVFQKEFIRVIQSDGEYKKVRLTMEYELCVQIKKMINIIDQEVIVQSKKERELLKEASDTVNNKIDELLPDINEILLNSRITLDQLARLTQEMISLNQVIRRMEEQMQKNEKEGNTAEVLTVPQGSNPSDIERQKEEIYDENNVLPVKLIHESKQRLRGEVFAVELLKRPIRISYDKYKGRYKVLIDRRSVENAIISNTAKTELCREYVENKRDILCHLDQEVHQFLLGNSQKSELVIDLPELGIPLRWASGGVLSVIKLWNNNQLEKWTPFFFRDINPCGWNIALGSSERQFDKGTKCIKPIDYELNYPPSFIFREFMEETLILENAPRVNAPAGFKRFYFDENRAVEQQREANFFAKEHINMRQEEEGLFIRRSEQEEGGFGNDIIQIYDNFDTKIDLLVIDRYGKPHTTNNVILTFNLLELGIEVIKVLEYSLDERNYILDGEILLRSSGASELVRMPCALMSHRALKHIFSTENYMAEYTMEVQPTLAQKSIKRENIKIFDWDIRQRYNRMTSESSRISEAEKKRYREAFHRFSVFQDINGMSDNISVNFNPGTAKALSMYFARE